MQAAEFPKETRPSGGPKEARWTTRGSSFLFQDPDDSPHVCEGREPDAGSTPVAPRYSHSHNSYRCLSPPNHHAVTRKVLLTAVKPRPLTICCPSGHRFLAPFAFVGKEVKCPYCGLPTIVPQPGDAPSSEATPKPPNTSPPFDPPTKSDPRSLSGGIPKGRAQAQQSDVSGTIAKQVPDCHKPDLGRPEAHQSSSPTSKPYSTAQDSPSSAHSIDQRSVTQADASSTLAGTPASTLTDEASTDSPPAEQPAIENRTVSPSRLSEATPELLVWWHRIFRTQREGLFLAVGCVLASSLLTIIGGIVALATGFPLWGWCLLAQAVLGLGTTFVLIALPDWTTTRNTGVFFAGMAFLCAVGTGLLAFASPEHLKRWDLASVHNQALRWMASLTLVYFAVTFVLLRVSDGQRRRADAFLHATRRGLARRSTTVQMATPAYRGRTPSAP